MEFRLTKEQEELQLAVRHFAETEVVPAVTRMEKEERFPNELVAGMAARGWMGIPIAKQWGGMGGDFISYIVAIHEISKASAALGVILSVHSSVCTLPILKHGTEAQRNRYVSKLAKGEWLGAFALTEPHAGSDAASIRTVAEKDGGHYVLNGAKLFITNAGAADVYLAFAVSDPEKRAKGVTAFLIDNAAPGVQVGLKERKMGLHGSNTCELIFDGLRLPESQVLGKAGEGFAIAMGSLDGGRIGIAAQALGIAEAALRLIEERFRIRSSRSAFTPQHAELAELTVIAEAARLLVYRAAWLRQEGEACTKEASMAKLFASDTAVQIAGAAVRLLGLEGCSESSTAERLFRDAKVTQIYEGTNEIHRIVISGQLLRAE
ncbi:acyl-CoA dehydrogenase family protein [Paenibacillus sp. NEAU-GSW1]|uniref:acyl-CoA dehydrogenase family protein n=1 Tax=Paenibacillus sp. NEAU-GSW1 TaxID=2682486 RepID=UPI0012E1FF24|nr:acyl-CoA dehydrogenase family protein [Paenibacillus sp. NEAU-GSW1]MUT68715.1 acyl-CoA dehydrogenase [Paenibacillus sp. NEAU-GSW1]